MKPNKPPGPKYLEPLQVGNWIKAFLGLSAVVMALIIILFAMNQCATPVHDQRASYWLR